MEEGGINQMDGIDGMDGMKKWMIQVLNCRVGSSMRMNSQLQTPPNN